MNQHKLHDALNLLDDDLIQSVEKLRNRQGNTRVLWIRRISAAACLCIVAAGFFAAGKFKWPFFDMHNKDAAKSEMSGIVNDEAENIPELSSVIVEIQIWQENGFSGTVNTGGTNLLPVGSQVTVLFQENICFDIPSETGEERKNGAPDSTDFPAGSIILVQFRKQKATDSTVPGESEAQYIIYAEKISPAYRD